MIQTYRGIRFVPINTDIEEPEYVSRPDIMFGSDDLEEVADTVMGLIMATSPDWDRTESEDDGLRAYGVVDGAEDNVDVWDGFYPAENLTFLRKHSSDHNIVTATNESFMVDEEPWVDDHTADDDGLHFWMFNERGDSTPGYTHGGWTIDYKEGIKDCIREYDGVCYTWLPEDFEPAPEPELCSPPTPEAAPPTGWGDRPDEFAWTVGLVLTYKTFTARLDMTVERPGDFTEAVKALVSTVKDIYKGVSLW